MFLKRKGRPIINRPAVSSKQPAVLAVAAESIPDLAEGLRHSFGSSVIFVSTLPRIRPQRPVTVAIGCVASDDRQGAGNFALRTQRWEIPALPIAIRNGAAFIGPLTDPNGAGCSFCTHERLAAAAEEASAHAALTPPGIGDAIAVVLRRELGPLRRKTRIGKLRGRMLVLRRDDSESWATSSHRVLPLPTCPFCGGARGGSILRGRTRNLSPDDAPARVLSALEGVVDPYAGIINRILIEDPQERGVDTPIVITAAPPRVRDGNGLFRRLPIGWGKGITLSGALLSAVGEALERYAPSIPDPSRITWKRAVDLEGDVLGPEAFPLYSEAQYSRKGFPYVRYDPRVRHPWVNGRWLGSERPVWLPAISVFLSVTVRQEHLFCQGTSNGLATSTTFADACVRAALELVERDALMASWLTGRAGQRVLPDETLDPRLRSVVDGIESLGATVELYLLRTSVIGTTALCLALGDGKNYPGVTIGLSANLNAHHAIKGAILELGQTGPHLRKLMLEKAVAVPRGPKAVREMLDHAAFYFPAERAKAFARLRDDSEAIPLRELKGGELEPTSADCARLLRRAGVRVAVVDVTSRDVALTPFRVARALSPDLQPISYGHGMEYEPVERIRRMGMVKAGTRVHPIW